jgi:glycosyltransferase involved in cell wall biosynthesis
MWKDDGALFTNSEVVVVDDGSKDGTAQIVSQHIAGDSRIRLLQLEPRRD